MRPYYRIVMVQNLDQLEHQINRLHAEGYDFLAATTAPLGEISMVILRDTQNRNLPDPPTVEAEGSPIQ